MKLIISIILNNFLNNILAFEGDNMIQQQNLHNFQSYHNVSIHSKYFINTYFVTLQ